MKHLGMILLAGILSACSGNEGKIAEETAKKVLKIESNSFLEVQGSEVGEVQKISESEKSAYTLLGIKDIEGKEVVVKIKSSKKCALVAETDRNDHGMKHKGIRCKEIKEGEKAERKYVSGWSFGMSGIKAFHKDAIIVKSGDTFLVKGNYLKIVDEKGQTEERVYLRDIAQN